MGTQKAGVLTDSARERLKAIRLFLCDVDGVLTDASVYMGQNTELKQFNIRDGLGLRILQAEGIRVGWVSARPSSATIERANDLKIDYLRQTSGSKVTAIEEILGEVGMGWREVAYMGDDVLDLGVLKRAGFAAAPLDATPEATVLAHYVCSMGGGRGAVREVAELILKAQGRWERLIEKFSS